MLFHVLAALCLGGITTEKLHAREIRVVSNTALTGGSVTVVIQMVADGNENAAGFSVNFPSSLMGFANLSAGSGLPAGTTFNANTLQASMGRLGFAFTLATGATFPAGTMEVARVTFNIGGTGGTANLTFGDTPVAREVVDVSASPLTTTFTPGSVVITKINSAPTLGLLFSLPVVMPEDSPVFNADFTGITAGSGDTQVISMEAINSNPALLSLGSLAYVSPSTTGSLPITFLPNAHGSATLTVTVRDDGGTASGGVDTFTTNFTITVTSVNDAPTADPISTLMIPEDAPAQTVNLSGISTGAANESQTITITAVSSNPTLIPNPGVTYASPAATGSLSFTPIPGASGTATITVTIVDNGGTANGGVDTLVRVFDVVVNSVNDAPTLDPLLPTTVNEDAAPALINLAGISTGALNETQNLLVTAVSSDIQIVPNPIVTYTSPAATGSLSLAPFPGTNGVVTITVTIKDDGGTANGGNDTIVRSFLVTVNPVNDAPTINPIGNVALVEDAPAQTVNFSGVGSGAANEAQVITVTVSSSNPSVIPNPAVTYTSPSGTGSLSFTPVSNASGSATITVTVMDDGGTANGGVNLKSTTFIVDVSPENDRPTITPIVNQQTRFGTPITIGFTVGDTETDPTMLVFMNKSSTDTTLIPLSNITFGGTGSSRTVTLSPVGILTGVATIGFEISDGLLSAPVSFVLTVVENELPTITALGSQTILEGGAGVSQSFTVGDFETAAAALEVTLSSSDTSLIPVGPANLGGSGASRTVQVTPVANGFGSATITVQVRDADGGTRTSSFLVTVNPVNDVPTLDTIPNLSIEEDAPSQTVNLTGISSGAANESQALLVTATSSNTGLIPAPMVTHASPSSTAQLQFTPVAHASGNAVVTVTVKDDGGTVSGGVDTVVRTFTVSVSSKNDLPTITSIPPQSTEEDKATSELAFTIGDVETAPAALSVVATSSNTAVVPPTGLALGGSGANRTIKVTPAGNAFGSATITLTVTDGDGGSSTSGFTVDVTSKNDLPTITTISDVTISKNTSTATIPFSIGDVETSASALIVDKSSSQTTVIPLSAIVLEGAGAARTVRVTPAADQIGASTITLTIRDADGGSSEEVFVVNVIPNAFPVISDTGSQSVNEDQELVISFTVSDPETAADSLQLSFGSSNESLFPSGSIAFGGTGGSRTARLKPAKDQFGTSTLTITVTDGDGASSSDSFNVAVNGVNDAPVIGDVSPIITLEDTVSTIVPIPVSDVDNQAKSLVLTAVSDNPGLFRTEDLILSGSDGIRSLTVKPLLNAVGNGNLTLTLSDGLLQATRVVPVRVDAANDAPSIGAIADQSIDEDQTLSLNLEVRDPDTRFDLIQVLVASSDTDLFPPGNVVYQPTTQLLKLRPTANRSGIARITVTATDDGGASSSSAFNLNVVGKEDAPTVTLIPDQSTSEGTPTTPILFTVSDADTALTSLVIKVSADNTTLVPSGSSVVTGADTLRTLVITPGAGQSGDTLVTVSVSDGVSTTSTPFRLKVTPINNLPEISGLQSVALLTGSASDPLQVLVFDTETPASKLELSAASSNPQLVPLTGLQLEGTDLVRTLVIRPAQNRTGESTITLSVKDSDGGSASTQFVVRVETTLNRPPTISVIRRVELSVGVPTLVSVNFQDPEDGLAGILFSVSFGDPRILPPALQSVLGTGGRRELGLTAASEGTTSLVVTVSDDDGGVSTETIEVVAKVQSGDTFTPSPKDDFNGDGLADLLLQEDGGRLAAWFLRGSTLIGGDFLIPSAVSEPAWRVAATGDFGGGAGPDIVFQHSDGRLAVWIMNNLVLVDPVVIASPDDANWRVVAAGDLDADGREDLVFQHRISGDFAVWLMDGLLLRAPSLTEPSRPLDAGWNIVGAADVSRDGKADLILQRGAEVAVWHMNGPGLLRGELLGISAPASVVAVADFNGDGNPDLAFRDLSGQLSITYLDRGVVVRSQPLTTPDPGREWSVVGPK